MSKGVSVDLAIIGGGIAGLGVGWDAILRGVSVAIIEGVGFGAGTTGASAGQVHSGLRYVDTDFDVARACAEEHSILCRTLGPLVDTRGAIMLTGPATAEVRTLTDLGRVLSTVVRQLDPSEAEEALQVPLVPGVQAFITDDALVLPRSLSEAYAAAILAKGGHMLCGGHVESVSPQGQGWTVRAETGNAVKARSVVCAAGGASGEVLSTAGVRWSATLIGGAMLRSPVRVSDRIVFSAPPRRPGDTIVPRSEGSLVGSTWSRTKTLDAFAIREVNRTVASMVKVDMRVSLEEPQMGERIVEGESGVLEYVGGTDMIIRTWVDDGGHLLGLVLPGKLTLHRRAAEFMVDRVCAHLGVTTECATRDHEVSVV